ncbi:sugar ABC transporter substrate-binding protein [Anaerolineales bacterium HSG6]|nr:sugar ABC transporter substrate-binding protein [Anaerolineales bacterium HSG6]MDM8531795.1 sugar ABC transporter substrate-binding protein [Anaerolineales bacterium HSG25]
MKERITLLLHLTVPPMVALVSSIGFLWWLFFPPDKEPINHFVDSPSPPAINKALPAQKTELEVWLDLDFTKDVALFDELVEEFEQAYPYIDVKISPFVRESISQRLRHAVLIGDPPDVVQGHVSSLAAQGLVEPLDQRIEAWDPYLVDEFLPVALEEAKWQDTLYGLPVDVYTVILLYNRDHFDEAGLPYPTSDYDLFDIRQAAKLLTKPDGERYGVGLTTDPWYFYAWLTSAGTDVITGSPETGFELTLNAKNNADVVAYLLEMIDEGYSPLPSSRPRDYEEARDLFLQEKLSLYFGEPQDVHYLQSNQPDFPLGVAPLPQTLAKDSTASVLGTSALFIPRGSRNPDAAFEFIKWASSDRYVSHMLRRTGRYPARKWMPNSPEVTENLLLAPFFTQLELARPYRLDVFLDAEEGFVNAVRSSFYHLAEPQEALDAAQMTGQQSQNEALRWSPQSTQE